MYEEQKEMSNFESPFIERSWRNDEQGDLNNSLCNPF